MQSLRSSRECPVCFESFDRKVRCPMGQPCGHSICQVCLQQIQSTEFPGVFRVLCPCCKSAASYTNMKHLKPNYTLMDAIDAMIAMETQCDVSDILDSVAVSEAKKFVQEELTERKSSALDSLTDMGRVISNAETAHRISVAADKVCIKEAGVGIKMAQVIHDLMLNPLPAAQMPHKLWRLAGAITLTHHDEQFEKFHMLLLRQRLLDAPAKYDMFADRLLVTYIECYGSHYYKDAMCLAKKMMARCSNIQALIKTSGGIVTVSLLEQLHHSKCQ